MDTCMRAEKVSPSRPTERGCPWALYRKDLGYSILGGNHKPCAKERGCPQKNDSDYQTNQLYNYPACLLFDIQTISEIHVIHITESTTTGLNIQTVNGGNAVSLWTILEITLAVAAAVVVIILIALGIILMWCRRKVPTYLEDLIKKFQPVSDIESSNHQGQDEHLLPKIQFDYANLTDTLLTKYENVSSYICSMPFSEYGRSSFYTPHILEKNNPIKLEDVFNKINKNNPEDMKIFMKGAAGTGKTVCCSKLLSDWCQAKKEERSSDRTEKKGIAVFDFVFYVPLQSLSEECKNVLDMVCTTLNKHLEMDIEQVLRNGRIKCLVLIDGLDEWQNSEVLPVSDGLANCTLFITSRPLTLNNLLSGYRETPRMLEIRGVNPPNVIKSLLNDILRPSSSDEKSELESKVKRCLDKTKDPRIKNILSLPIMLTISCHMWMKEEQEQNEGTNSDPKNLGGIATVHSFTCHLVSILNLMIRQAITKNRDLYSNTNDAGTSRKFFTDNTELFLSTFQYINDFMNIFKPFCKVAFSALVHRRPLVFSLTELKNFEISERVVDSALQIGIIRKPTTLFSPEQNGRNVIFFHKLVQELMAALFILQNDSDIVEMFCKKCSSINDIKEMQNVILFVSGMDPEIACILSKHVTNLMNKCSDVGSWRQTLDKKHGNVVKQMNKMQYEWYSEMQTANQILKPNNTMYHFCVTDVYLKQKSLVDKVEMAQEVLRNNENTIKSVYLRQLCIPEKTASQVLAKKADRLSVVKYLGRHTSSITSLGVYSGDIEERKHLAIILPELRELKCFQYEGSHRNEDIAVVRALTNLAQFLKLKSFGDHSTMRLDLSKMKELRELVLDNVEMSSDSWKLCICSLQNKHMHIILHEIHESEIDEQLLLSNFPSYRKRHRSPMQVSFELN